MWGAECEKCEGEKCECGRDFCRCGEGGTESETESESETDEEGEVYYILSNYNLTQVESKPSVEEYEEESRIVVNGRTEITYKKIGSDEGGNDDRVEY
jgi:hypothetical protein